MTGGLRKEIDLNSNHPPPPPSACNSRIFIFTVSPKEDGLCGLVVRVFGYRSRGPGFDSWRFQIF
jgi:hypothetical protein